MNLALRKASHKLKINEWYEMFSWKIDKARPRKLAAIDDQLIAIVDAVLGLAWVLLK